ncbi:alpha/beta hydrolase [Nitrosomonas europaea]|uniref:alpha/beta fold hydrolase n=1 Tax=Nitrosomonas europaea TaxID=915 RepID=UPI003266015C
MMERITSRDGTPIACWRQGSGPPLLLVHGTTSDHSTWGLVLAGLQQHHTVWTLDRRGRGHSGDAANYSLEHESEDIAAVIDAIGSSVNLLGHSFGGLCALEASLLTANINKVVLYEPAISLAGSDWSVTFEARMQALLGKNAREETLLLFFRDLLNTPNPELVALQAGSNWAIRLAAAHTILRELQGIDRYQFTPQRFQTLTPPVLLLVGGNSHPRRFMTAERLQQGLPDCRVGIIAGQQHSAMRTAPDLFVHHVLEFLQSAD